MKQNRTSLRAVKTWISDEAYAASVDHYGLPLSVRHLIDLPIGDEPTYSDLLVHYAGRLTMPVTYLEVGVSVGKNFYQVLNALNAGRLVGLDCEETPPGLRPVLGSESERLDAWPTPESLRGSEFSYLDHYPAAAGGNEVDYLCGSVWDPSAWERLAGRRFNLVLSDAEHSPGAIRHEATMLERHDLLDPRGFVILWDDLGGPMTDAFIESWERLRDRFSLPNDCVRLGLARGWLGVNEPPHLVGVVMNLDERTTSNASIETMEDDSSVA